MEIALLFAPIVLNDLFAMRELVRPPLQAALYVPELKDRLRLYTASDEVVAP